MWGKGSQSVCFVYQRKEKEKEKVMKRVKKRVEKCLKKSSNVLVVEERVQNVQIWPQLLFNLPFVL